MPTITTTIHIGADGVLVQLWARGETLVGTISGRDAGRKASRLQAAGFVFARSVRANDMADLTMDGEWIDDADARPGNVSCIEAIAGGPEAAEALRIAHGIA